MPKVVVLSKEVADKIAAGEVVDRPASIVKELVENSIDAGATRVEVELEDGGKRRITVTDNGCGMLLEDAVVALERHATSKIRAADDLFSVRTLGFRGEALPSIAAVSHLRIQTRAVGQDTGVEVTVDQGGIAAAEQRGVPQGTQVTVTHLFSNVPARLKFLKTTQTELSHIVDLMVRFALSYPGIHFKLAHNSRMLFQSPGSGDPLNTVVAAYGREVAKEMLPVATPEEAPVAVRGYTSRPSVTRTSRSHQAFFVNGRLVRSPMLSRALDEAYKGYVPAGRYPVACLFIDVDPAQVDVNVHPTKMEVRFASEREVFAAAVSALRRTLVGVNLAQPAFPTRVEQSIEAQTLPDDPFSDPDQRPADPGEAAPAPRGVREPAVSVPYSPTVRPPLPPASRSVEKAPEWHLNPAETQPALGLEEAAREPAREEAPPAVVPAADAPSAPPAETAALPNLTPVARVLDTYLICEGPDAVYIIDQHAAHERIIYDALLRREENDIAPQPLLIPLTLNLSHSDAAALESHREALQELGFEIEPFGRDTYIVRSVPAILVGHNYEAMLRDLLDDLRERERTGRLEEMRSEICALVACHSVTRSGDPLSPEEMARLVQDLRESPSPYTCAHGRPTLLVLSRSDLERQIGRG
jgi:DNA mismatch repair protein MutL